jgi:hypothetical protein
MRKILAQIFKRKGAKPQSRRGNFKNFNQFSLKNFAPLRLCALAFITFLFLSACRTTPADLRRYAPADSVIYLETNDLEKALNAATENESFKRLTDGKKDFSTLKGIQLAVAVTGFETSEKQITDSKAVLDFRPQFVAVADTHAWEFQAVSLVENQIDGFVRETYGRDAGLEKTEKLGGRFFTWTGPDGRKVHAFVEGSLIFFGNNEEGIEKALAAGRGEAENLTVSAELETVYEQAKDRLAFGFVSGRGIRQIAEFAGVSAAIETSEDALPRNFIAKVLPEILSGSIKRAVWTMDKTESGVEDRFRFETAPEISSVLTETFVAAQRRAPDAARFVPADVHSATVYNFADPQIAWRSLLLSAGRQTDEQSARFLTAFSDSFFAPFGIADGEDFLSAAGPEILTARLDAEGERQIAVASVKDAGKLKKSLFEDFKKQNENENGAELWKMEDEELAAAFTGNLVILGDAESVSQSLQAGQNGENFARSRFYGPFTGSSAPVVTFGKDGDAAHKIAALLGKPKNKDLRTFSYFLTETRFEGGAFVRRTISDFGFIGTILEQFAER